MSKLKSNIAYNLSYQILILIIPLITAPYLSRVLGVDGTGTYSYVFSVAYYFFIVTTLGLANYGNRAIAKVKENRELVSKTFWSIYFMQLSIGVLATAAYLLYAFFIAELQFRMFFIAFIPYVVSAVFDINWFFFGLTEFKFTTIRNTAVKILSLVFIFSFVKAKDDLLLYFVIMGGTFLLSNLLLWTRVKKKAVFILPSIRDVIVHIKPNIILFVPILAMSIYRVMDKIMIKELSSITENGYYENADKIIAVALTVFSAVATVMMPSVSNMVAQGKRNEIKILIRDTMQISMFLGFGMLFGLVAVGRVFAPIYFGEEFYETGVLIQCLAFTIVISGWKAVLRSQFIIPYEKDKAYVISLVTGAIVNVICNYIFIQMYQARGAVIGTLAAEFVGFAIQTGVAAKEINIWRLVKDGGLFAVPGIIMAGVVLAYLHFTGQGLVNLCIAILIGVVVYTLLGVLVMRVYDKERLLYFKRRFLDLKKEGEI